MKKSRFAAFSGIASALSLVLLSLGSVIWIFSYIMPLICGFAIALYMDLFGKKSALLTYLCVSILAIFLLSDKESALLYASFFGIYPLFREKISKSKSRFFSYLVKFVVFNASVILAEIICVYVFLIPFDNFLGNFTALVLLALANILFVFYEKLFSILVVIYNKKLKNRITKYLQ